MITIQEKAQKRALFAQEFRTVIETKNVLSDVSTKVIAKAKNIVSPFHSVTDAKAHKIGCQIPLGVATHDIDELVLDRYIGNAITDCEDNLSYSQFNLTEGLRGDLYASVMEKANKMAVEDVVASGTIVADIDLSTKELVQEFIINTNTTNKRHLGVKTKVDGAKVVKGKFNGKAFVAAGSEAFVNMQSKIATIVSLSSLKALNGNMTMTPYGVVLVDLQGAEDDPKRLIFGTAGAITLGYREDKIEVDMGEVKSISTASVDSLDVMTGDDVLKKTWFISAQTLGKNGVFSNVKELVNVSKMA